MTNPPPYGQPPDPWPPVDPYQPPPAMPPYDPYSGGPPPDPYPAPQSPYATSPYPQNLSPTNPFPTPQSPYSPNPYGGPVMPYSGPPMGYLVGAAVDPVTGRPLSDKSKVVAGLLQLLPGFFMGLGGIGRLYAGNTTLGILQLAATVIGWTSFICGFFLVLPFFIFAAVWWWFVIDGIILLAGRPVDGQGRQLRT